MAQMSRRGFSMIELMLGSALLIGGGGAMLLGMRYTMIHQDYLNDVQIAMIATHGKLEQVVAANTFDQLVAMAGGMTGTGVCLGMGEDVDCDGILDVGEDENGNGQLDEPLPGGRLTLLIRPSPAGDPDPDLLDVHLAACWNTRGRSFGEDQNCDGLLQPAEDDPVNGHVGWADSPVMVSIRVGRQT